MSYHNLFIMKCLLIYFLFILMTVAIKAQDIDSSTRKISLTILAKKERPMSNIIVSSLNTAEAGFTNRLGMFVFADMTDNDTISMMLPRLGEIFIPVARMDSIVVKLRSARRYYYVTNEGPSEIFGRRSRNFNQIRTESTDLLDVQEMLSRHTYRSLVELLQGVAGLTITPTSGERGNGFVSANIRGPVSINGSNEPIVVLDGQMIGTLNVANNMVNIYDIKTIEVQKNATQWGVFGANGAIVIKTQ